jgi:ArsR family transcriptional regulator
MSIQRCCPPAEIPARDFEEAAAVLKAIADPYRLAVLATLDGVAEACVCDFTDAFPLNQPTVSHHLKLLRDADLVTAERRGTWVYYALAPTARARISAALGSAFPESENVPGDEPACCAS